MWLKIKHSNQAVSVTCITLDFIDSSHIVGGWLHVSVLDSECLGQNQIKKTINIYDLVKWQICSWKMNMWLNAFYMRFCSKLKVAQGYQEELDQHDQWIIFCIILCVVQVALVVFWVFLGFFNKSCNLLSLELGMGMTDKVHRRSSDQKEIAEAIYVNVLEWF